MRLKPLPFSLMPAVSALALGTGLLLGAVGQAAPARTPAKAKSAKAAPRFKVPKGDTLVLMQTARGPIYLQLYTKQTPLTAGNFVKLAKKGFYNGQSFHRVEPGFVIQAGDPYSKHPESQDAQMRMGSGGPGYTIKLEPSALKFKHVPGVLAMARRDDPDSAGSQFYITLGAAPFLDGKYAVFGKVLSGIDVAKKIQRGDKIEKVAVLPSK